MAYNNAGINNIYMMGHFWGSGPILCNASGEQFPFEIPDDVNCP